MRVQRFFFLTLISSFLSATVQAQLAIIQDKDGYTNVRDSGDINASVKFKVLHGQVMELGYYEGEEPLWIPVKIGGDVSESECYRHQRTFRSGFMHGSRVLKFKDIPNTFIGKKDKNQAIVDTLNLQVVLTIEENVEGPEEICRLGSDMGVGAPSNHLTNLEVTHNGKKLSIPQTALEYLYHVDLKTLSVHEYQDMLLIKIGTHSAAGYYECAWVFQNDQFRERYVYYGNF